MLLMISYGDVALLKYINSQEKQPLIQ